VKFYYSNGKISSEGQMKNGRPDGYGNRIYEDGTLKSEGDRQNFTLSGHGNFIMKKEHWSIYTITKQEKKIPSRFHTMKMV
jgi:antitoxin component YwqK of YwqJK toxin-antitoxin module